MLAVICSGLLIAKSPLKRWTYQIPLVFFGVVNYMRTDSSWGLYSILFVLFAEYLPLRNIMHRIYKMMLIIWCIALLSFIAAYAVGGSYVVVQSIDRVRYAMGFTSPNFAAQYWMSFVFLAYYLYGIFKRKYMICVILMSVLVYVLTDSDALAFLFIIPILDWMEKKDKFSTARKWMTRISFPALAAMTFILVRTKNALYYFLDTYFTGRLSLANVAFQEYPMTWLGQKVELYRGVNDGTDWHFLVVDNAYAYISISFGLVYLLLISYVYFKNRNVSNVRVQACLIMYALAALAENNILSPYMIFPVIMAFNLMRLKTQSKQ